MRILQVGEHPTRLAQAIAEIGRIEKTVHVLRYLDDESKATFYLSFPIGRRVVEFNAHRVLILWKYLTGQQVANRFD